MINIEQVGKTGIIIYGREKDGTRYSRFITDFKPYFYNDKKEKIICEKPSDVPILKKNYPETYEADIPYLDRFLIDNYDAPLNDEPLRICVIDIETNVSLDTKNTPKPIICMNAYDNFIDRFITFIWREDLEERIIKGYKDDSRHNVFFFNSEEKMMSAFIKFIQDTDPDIITGYNVSKFDLSYMINRCKRLGIPIHNISPSKYVAAAESGPDKPFKRKDAIIRGRVVIDFQRSYKKSVRLESPSWTLDYVAKKELKLSKKNIDPNNMWKDIDILIEYNKFDVELVKNLEDNLHLIEDLNIRRRLAGCTWGSALWNSMTCDILLLREAKKRGMFLPTGKERAKIPYTGALVKSPIKGFHKNAILMDLRGLYPSIMCQFNISYDTLDENGKIHVVNGAKYVDYREGLIPTILKRLFSQRDEYKRLRSEMKEKFGKDSKEYDAYDRLQFGTKELYNSFYGVLGFSGYRGKAYSFRLYNPKIAESVTSMGQEIIKHSIKEVEKMGYKILYGDTDSIFILSSKNTIDETVKVAKEIQKNINISYEDFVKKFGCEKNDFLFMDFKCIFESILFTDVKKRYMGLIVYEDGILENPELHITGFEQKHSKFPQFGKDLFERIFDMIVHGKTKEEITNYVKMKKEKLKKENDIDSIAIPISMKKDVDGYARKPAQIRGAEYANKYLGESFYGGVKLNWLYVKEVKGKPPTDVICYSNKIPEGIVIDWNKMFKSTIDNKLDRLFDALGWGEYSDAPTLGRWVK